ncbi:undecaprenyl-diphosphate phosphatase [Polynucleobacter sp. MWH-Spelu-300-X4]|uniref:undecaprenyl-diphosphate phosphatase n=1 Tax=Polynucleobacter sp. MWH-Spelu-300-X4 TaxID=2689109 RepID=UPI001BFD96EB|nr:undecaprenyl-diphosphate phosphatase [Polynucleobacter sp. MWH-Spelu-300-X4]QWD80078.1 undecaprenyl-diphosphate phosphatase [Polynucleobacter sp. MWH-Spelu-300-X4]
MDINLLIQTIILGLVEGLTEFLPISSTGHLILVGDLLNFNDEKGKAFEVIIQFGAILAVCWEYRQKLITVVAGLASKPLAQRFAINVIIATIPAITLALLFGKFIKSVLFSPIPVAMAFIVGALIIFWAESIQKNKSSISNNRIQTIDDLRWQDALKIGLAQCAALIPGTSRSGATIIGGMLFGLPRKVATEFSFFLAIPVIAGATLYELIKLRHVLGETSWATFGPVLAVGFVVSFISAFACIRWLIRYVASHDFKAFAWYRIVFGVVVLVTAWTGIVQWSN